MTPIMYQPSYSIEGALEAFLDNKEENHFRIGNALDESFQGAKEREISFHLRLLSMYAVDDPNMDANQYQLATKRIYAQRTETRGRKAKYKLSKRNPTYVRAIRLWFVNQLIAKGLGVEFTDPLPPEPITAPEEIDIIHTYIEDIDSIMRFEEYTGYRLPRAAYVLHTRKDRQALRHIPDLPIRHTDWVEDGVTTLKFEEYSLFRQDPAWLEKFRRYLAKLKFREEELEVFQKAA